MTALMQTGYVALRHLRALWRQPWWIAVTLVQPVVWLLLYGALFKRVVEIPGFQSTSYIEFLAPGVVVNSAIFSAGWGGMSLIDDIRRGVLDRFLVTPVRRTPLIMGRLVQGAVVVTIQSFIIVGLAMITGAHYPSVFGVLVLVGMSAMLGAAFGAFSNGLALLARREETLIAAMNFMLLPLTFLSAGFMQKNLMPAWMQRVADFNPVNWTVEAGRQAAMGNTDWAFVASRVVFLALFLLACLVFATRAFRSYQRSI